MSVLDSQLQKVSFRNYNKPKKRIKPKAPKKRLPKTAKGFKNDLL